MAITAKQENGPMPQRLLKCAARLQEMADIANPMQAEEDRAKVFMHYLPHAQAASRRLQGHLGIYSDETWPLPLLPSDRNIYLIETNGIKIRTALENCKDFAVTTDRVSAKLEFLDVSAKHTTKRVVVPAGHAPQIRVTSFEDEKKASEADESVAIAHTADEGLQEDLKELQDECMSGKSPRVSTPTLLTRIQSFLQPQNPCLIALALPLPLPPFKSAKGALKPQLKQPQSKMKTCPSPLEEAAQSIPQSVNGVRSGKNLRKTLVSLASDRMDGLSMMGRRQQTQQVAPAPVVPPQSGYIERTQPLIRTTTLKGIRYHTSRPQSAMTTERCVRYQTKSRQPALLPKIPLLRRPLPAKGFSLFPSMTVKEKGRHQ